MEDQKLQNKFFRRSLEFVISVCVLCFFVWYSSFGLGFSILVHDQSFKVFLFSIITRTLHRKYMFLICNCILAFLSKTSSSTISSSPPNFTLDLPALNLQDTKAQIISEVEYTSLLEEIKEEEEEEVELTKKRDDCKEMQEDDSADKEMEEGKDEALTVDEDEEEGEEEEVDAILMPTNEELWSIEELNGKFEEFISKMKEEIRIDAQRQLVTV